MHDYELFLIILFFHQLHGTNFQRKSEQVDEAVSVVVIDV